MKQTAPVEVRARRRITRRLIPYLMFIYLLAYLDRANLGVAKLQMQGDLGFTDEIIGFGAGIFFLGYLLLDIPGSLIVERWSARKWMARIMVSWGLVASLMGLLGMPVFGAFGRTTQFYGLRLLLGISEAGFFPGVIVYLSHWFPAQDRTRAKAYFMLTQPISLALGLPLSRWILENVHWHSLPGWRWVFFLEGAPCVVLGFVTWWFLTDRPRQAGWLPDDEKKWLMLELDRETRAHEALGQVRIGDALRDRQTLLLTAISFLVVTGNQSLIFFLPSITDSMRSISITARTVFTALPYACSAAGILLNGMWSHHTGERRWHVAGPMLCTGASLAMTILAGRNIAWELAFFCLAGFTAQAYLPVFWTLPTTLLGKSAAATAVGLISLGSVGGFAGPYLFGYLKTATGDFHAGLWFLAGCMVAAGALATQIRPARAAASGRNGSQET
jgi:MFS family permease